MSVLETPAARSASAAMAPGACEAASAPHTDKLCELTMADNGFPAGMCSPPCSAMSVADGQPLPSGEPLDLGASAGCRLAAVNDFTLNPEEPQRNMQELVQALIEELSSGKKDLNRLYNLMMSYDYRGNEWKRFEYWDPKKKYTRNLIASVPGCLCLMLLCWNPENASPIHNHAGSECFMRIVQGRLIEQQYIVRNGEGDASAQQNWNKMTCSNIPPSDLIVTHRNVYETGGTTFINDSLGVHAVENPYKEPAVSLHCYIPGYDTCKSWSADASAPDPQKAVKIQQCTISYDTEQGERTHA